MATTPERCDAINALLGIDDATAQRAFADETLAAERDTMHVEYDIVDARCVALRIFSDDLDTVFHLAGCHCQRVVLTVQRRLS